MAGADAGLVGIDFGTATTLAAAAGPGGRAELVHLGRTTLAMPSAVGLDGTGALVVGEEAEALPADQVVRSVKGAITRRSPRFELAPPAASSVDADEAVAAVLREAVARARAAGLAAGSVRLGCPATWDGAQRRRLLDVAARVGLSVDALVEEPVAAGLAWLTHTYLTAGARPTGTLLVVDMGGGTLDVAVLRVTGGPRPQVAVLSCLGTVAAGDALDAALARDLAGLVATSAAPAQLRPELAWALLERAAREAKVRLSRVEEHSVVLPPQLGHAPPVPYPRRRLETAFAQILDGTGDTVVAALRLARLATGSVTPAQLRAFERDELAAGVDHVLLVGGMSHVPALAAHLGALLPKAAVVADLGVAPEAAVAAGLADPVAYAGLRLYRPPVDLVLDTPAGRVVAYEAHTPLVEPWQVYGPAAELGYDRWLRPPEVPELGTAMLRGVTADGDPLWLTLGGARVDGLPVPLGPHGVAIGLTCDGRIGIVDGTGASTALATDGWPVPGRDRLGPTLRTLPATLA